MATIEEIAANLALTENEYEENTNVYHIVPQSITLSDIESDVQEQEWLVQDVVPLHALTMFSANPGSGKSTFVYDLIAAITNGIAWHGHETISGDVLYVMLEDNIEKIVKGLKGVKANLRRIHVLNEVQKNEAILSFKANTSFKLPDHFTELRNEMKIRKPTLVVIDALGRAVGTKSNKVQEEIAEGLRDIANETGISIIMINHLNKGYYNEKNIVSRLANSIAFHALARISYLAVHDESNDIYAMLTIKNNLNRKQAPIIFKIVENMKGDVFIELQSNDVFNIKAGKELDENNKLRKKILACLEANGPSNAVFIAQYCDINYNTTRAYLSGMKERQEIELLSRGIYDIPRVVIEKLAKDATKESESKNEILSDNENGLLCDENATLQPTTEVLQTKKKDTEETVQTTKEDNSTNYESSVQSGMGNTTAESTQDLSIAMQDTTVLDDTIKDALLRLNGHKEVK